MGKSAGRIAKAAVKTVANTSTLGLYGAATSKEGNFLENAAKSFGGAVSGLTMGQAYAKEGSKILADATGATAAQEGLQQSLAQSQAEARRQALMSDALARDSGGELARVSINTGRNRKAGGSSATGISGTSASQGTGVQS